MTYTPYHADWKDYPDVTTPITAAAMEYIEAGIVAATDGSTWINVQDYGATGDGSTDDTTAIQDAIDAAAATAASGAIGGIVFVPKGIYILNGASGLSVKNRVRLVGAGRAASIIKAGASFTGTNGLVRLGDGTSIVFGCTVEHMQINCNDVATKGIYSTEINEQSGVFYVLVGGHTDIGIHITSTSAQNFALETLEVYGSSTGFNDDIHLDGVASTNWISRVTTHKNTSGTGTNGIHLTNCNTILTQIHGERTTNGILFESSASGSVNGYVGRSTVTNCINIASGNGGNIELHNISANSAAVTILNTARGETITDSVVASYVFANVGGGAGILKNSYHSQNSPEWRVGAVIGAVQGVRLGDSGKPTITTGAGSPEGVLSAPVGSIYTNYSPTTASCSFETGSNSATISTSDSGSEAPWDSVSIGTDAALVYDNANANDTLAAKVSTGATSATCYLSWSGALGTRTDHYGRIYLYMSGNPAATVALVRFQRGSTQETATISISSAGKILLVDSNGTTQATSTASISTAQFVRIEWHVVHSTTVGQIEAKLFNTPGSGTADETVATAASINTRADCDEVRFGQSLARSNMTAFWMDDLLAGATSYPGTGVPAAEYALFVKVRGTSSTGWEGK